mmetsp:Transcript_117774/g.328053  ORF Transcript_117774/g.328053 Transcript_117774/m.328053 type:complete len:260 (-) Transcript_117774:97-876(-)
MDGRFDELLLGMAQKHRGIEDLLYSIMSFFERHTDLFHVKEGDDRKGFEQGKAEEMLRRQFQGFQGRYLSRAQSHLLVQRPSAGAACASSSSGGAAAADAGAGGSGQESSGGSRSSSSAAAPPASANDAAASAAPKKQAIPEGVNASPLDGGDPGLWERNQNKAVGFVWNQSVQEVTMEIDVEKCSASDIKVVLASKRICVKRKGEVIVEGNLHDKINCEDSTWHLDSGKQIVLSLEKIKPMFWDSFFDDSATRAAGRA